MLFDVLYFRIVDIIGVESVFVLIIGYEKIGFIVVFVCLEFGKKFKLMVIFKRKIMLKENFFNGVVVYCYNKGWMDRDGMVVWGEKVWCLRFVFFDRIFLFIFDSFSVYIDKNVRNIFKIEYKIIIVVIFGGFIKKS